MTSEDRDPLDDEAGSTEPLIGGPRSSPSPRPTQRKRRRRQLPVWQETVLLLAVALLMAVVIKAFFLQAFYIPSESMEPGLVENDRILVQKVSYWGDDSPERGDVVVFKDPDQWLPPEDSTEATNLITKGLTKIGLFPTGGHLVKRVIGTPGDTVKCCDDEGRLSINGYAVNEEEYVAKGGRCAAPMLDCKMQPVTIPDGYLLVMGDNREHSADSTAHMCRKPKRQQCAPTRGLVPIDHVVGKVWTLIWPANRWDHISRPDVFDKVPDPK